VFHTQIHNFILFIISHIPLLDKDEEIEIFRRIQLGEEIILDAIWLNWLITPYLNIFEEFRKSFEKAKNGDFSQKISTKLNNEVKNIVENV
jgi:hypothetical protein